MRSAVTLSLTASVSFLSEMKYGSVCLRNSSDDVFVSAEGESLRRSGTDMIPKARMKTLKMTVIIVMSFVVCWTPYYLLGIWYWFQPDMVKVMPEYIHHLLFVFGNLNTCCDPVIYGLFTPSFRADLARCCRPPADSPRSLDRLSARHESDPPKAT